ncbi:HrpT family type III secretion system protein [Sodalis sp. dw_96]|uniref:HrpT family type III secretion system protein n=1 Tax=Sodalis sp. dw_96 TaxID=2719794 RepID=UPI0031F5FF51
MITRKLLIVIVLSPLLSACAQPKTAGCEAVSCRPGSDPHRLTIWWQQDLRNGPYDYTQVQIND